MRGRAKARIAVFCSGYGSNFQSLIDAARWKSFPATLALMVCDKPEAHALARAKKHKIPVALLDPKLFKNRETYEHALASILHNESIDLVVLAGFMRIFTPYFIRAFKGRILNIHPSYLPSFKGAHAIRDAFEAKVFETGVTVHLVTADVDSGPILLQKKVPVKRSDSLAKLEKRIHKMEHKIYPKAVSEFIKRNWRPAHIHPSLER